MLCVSRPLRRIEARCRHTQDATTPPDREGPAPTLAGCQEDSPSYDTATAHRRGTRRCAPHRGGAE
jgi:hypothetical protein